MKDGLTAKESAFCTGAGADTVHGYMVDQYRDGRLMARQFVPAENFHELQKIFPEIVLSESA